MKFQDASALATAVLPVKRLHDMPRHKKIGQSETTEKKKRPALMLVLSIQFMPFQ